MALERNSVPDRWLLKRGGGILSAWLKQEIAALHPGAFALVMATGIVSNALFFEQYNTLSDVLFAINVAAYVLLIGATTARIAVFGSKLLADLVNPRTVFAFFTLVAATDVFGAGLVLRGFSHLAVGLWLFALLLWLALIYFSFAVLTFLNRAHRANVIDGGWLLAIVGAESLVVLGTQIARGLAQDSAAASFVLIHLLWGVGLALYGIFTTLFAYRLFFFDVEPDDTGPLLWVVMGAAAISTNAGTMLIVSDNHVPFLNSMRSFIDGITLITWAWATWWIPLLVLLGVWKHLIRRLPVVYTPTLWGLVFPLGMYALATLRLARTAGVPALRDVSLAMMWVALFAWAATMLGLLRANWQSYRDFAGARRNSVSSVRPT